MTEPVDTQHSSIHVGRYVLHRQIARGGMATIHIARLMGDEGFSRIVAAKRLLPELAEDTEFVAMFMDEARIASKVHHPNVVPVLDLVTTSDEVMLVQEYVHGVPLHVLLRTAHEQRTKIPVRIAVSIATQVLAGLQAAHTTVDEMGAPLHIIHRDVSPQNVMIAVDGSARLLDFGVAKTTIAAHVTRDGTFKGKLAYSAPEQVKGKPTQQSDVYALAVVLWELLVGHRMHNHAQAESELIATILAGSLPTITDALMNDPDWGALTSDEWKALALLDPIVQKGLATDTAARWKTATEMEEALAHAVPPASASEVAAWLKGLGKAYLETRDKVIAAEEASWRKLNPKTQSARRSVTVMPPPSSGSTVNTHVTMAPAPRQRRPHLVIGVLGSLVVLLGIGVVFAVQASDDPVPARADAPPLAARPSPPPPPAPAAVHVSSAPAPAPSVDEPASPTPSPGASTPAPEPAVDLVPEHVEPKVAPHPRKKVARPAATPMPAPMPAPAAAPAAAPTPTTDGDCNPPYYFEGSKKVFKPQCL